MDPASLHSRRGILRLAAGGLALGGIALLEACGPSAAPAPTVAPTAAPPPPTAAPKPTAASAATTASQPTAATQPTAAPANATPNAAAPTGLSGQVPGQLPISKNITLPSRIPIPGAPPDLPGSADGLVDPGYV